MLRGGEERLSSSVNRYIFRGVSGDMIKADKHKKNISKILLPAIMVMIAAVSRVGYSQTYDYYDPDEYYDYGYALMIEQSPVDAGKITPHVGIHRVKLNEVVVLKAIPKPGYRFIYWLGDVTDVATNETTIVVGAPKIVIAVFERTEFDLPEFDVVRNGLGRGGGSRVPDFSPRSRRVGSGWEIPDRPEDIDEEPGMDFPVPEDEDFPVPEDEDFPVPEPTTVVLLSFGAVPLMLGRRKRKSTT